MVDCIEKIWHDTYRDAYWRGGPVLMSALSAVEMGLWDSINTMSKALAVDLGPYGIRSNVVLPGTIKTQRWVEMGSKQIVNGEMTPIGDISDFEDIANAVWFLGSDETKNITGAEIMLDGGMTAQLFPERLKFYKSEYINGADQ